MEALLKDDYNSEEDEDYVPGEGKAMWCEM
jgi:hypothetical protein